MPWPLDTPSTDLRTLIDGTLAVDATETLDSVSQQMDARQAAFAAVCEAGRVVGLCSRSRIRRLLGGRYGFSLHSRTQARHAMTGEAHSVRIDTSLRDVLHSALSREGDAFYRDIVVVEPDGAFAGLVSTRRLVAAQNALVEEQFSRLASSLARQHELERSVIEKEKLTLLETLAGGIAHEINNKLHPVVGYAELLAEDADVMTVSDIRAAARSMLQCAVESSRIIAQLLRLSRPPRSELGACDLREVVEQSLTLARLRTRGTRIGVSAEAPPEAATVLADAAQLRQVVMNLVVNAIDAVEQAARPEVRVRILADTRTVTLEVADNGSGIPPEHLPRIFDPFFTTKAPGRGTGLGLGVCAAILRQHGTTLEVESSPGQGARFRFSLPRRTPGVDPAPPAEAQDARTGTPMRVLVVDDDPLVRGVIRHALTHLLGCTVDEARDGIEGRDALTRERYDTVLCDVRMPGMSGIDLARWLEAQHPGPAPRTILMTGDAGEALGRELDATGACVLRKPFTMHRLMEVLQASEDPAPPPPA